MEVLTVDSHILDYLQACPTKMKLAYIDNLIPMRTESHYDMGNLMHDMLRLYYLLQKHHPNWNHDKMVNLCIRLGRKKSLKLDLPIEDCEYVIEYFQHYCRRWVDDAWKVIFVEKSFARVLYEDESFRIVYQGRPDLGVLIPTFPGMVPIDHKTGERDIEPKSLSNQFIGYCWALGVQNLVINKINYYKEMKPDKSFRRYIKSYPEAVIEEWVEETVNWCHFLRAYLASGKFPRCLCSCWNCRYTEICEQEPSAREYVMQTRFKTREKSWDVGEGLR